MVENSNGRECKTTRTNCAKCKKRLKELKLLQKDLQDQFDYCLLEEASGKKKDVKLIRAKLDKLWNQIQKIEKHIQRMSK